MREGAVSRRKCTPTALSTHLDYPGNWLDRSGLRKSAMSTCTISGLGLTSSTQQSSNCTWSLTFWESDPATWVIWEIWHLGWTKKLPFFKKYGTSRICVSSLCRGHTNFLCIDPEKLLCIGKSVLIFIQVLYIAMAFPCWKEYEEIKSEVELYLEIIRKDREK